MTIQIHQQTISQTNKTAKYQSIRGKTCRHYHKQIIQKQKVLTRIVMITQINTIPIHYFIIMNKTTSSIKHPHYGIEMLTP